MDFVGGRQRSTLRQLEQAVFCSTQSATAKTKQAVQANILAREGSRQPVLGIVDVTNLVPLPMVCYGRWNGRYRNGLYEEARNGKRLT